MDQSGNAYNLGSTEGKSPLGRPRGRWEDNIKIDLKEVGCDSRIWMDVAQDWDQWQAYLGW